MEHKVLKHYMKHKVAEFKHILRSYLTLEAFKLITNGYHHL
jgi:hypothetical protein